MKRNHSARIAALCLGAALMLNCTACAANGGNLPPNAPEESASQTPAVSETAQSSAEASPQGLHTVKDLFTDRDLRSSVENAARITLADGASRTDAAGVTIAGDTVTITQEGNYLLTGTLANGQIIVDAPKDAKIQLVLENASVSRTGSAALYVRQADKVFVTTAEGSTNTLASSGSFVQTDENKVDGAVFSKEDITLNGAGSLTVSCQTGHGIVGKDDVKLAGGTVTVEAAKKGISAKDSLSIADGSLTVNSGTSALHCENSDDSTLGGIFIGGGALDLTTGSDGIHAAAWLEITGGTIAVNAGDDGLHADGALTITGGTVNVSRSYEGIEGATVTITGGRISVTASDDGINAADGTTAGGMRGGFGAGSSSASILIRGGTLEVNAQGDGVDSNGTLRVEGGALYVSGPTNSGNGAIDYEFSGTVTGGVVVAAGAAGMAQNFGSESTQGAILWNLSSTMPGGTAVTLADAQGNVLAAYTPVKNFQTVVFSAPGITAGADYILTAGNVSETITMGDSLIYNAGGGAGGFGGRGGMADRGGFGGGKRPQENGMPQPPQEGGTERPGGKMRFPDGASIPNGTPA